MFSENSFDSEPHLCCFNTISSYSFVRSDSTSITSFPSSEELKNRLASISQDVKTGGRTIPSRSRETCQSKPINERITLEEFQRQVQHLATMVDNEQVGLFPVVFILKTDEKCSESCVNQPRNRPENEITSDNATMYSIANQTTKRERKVLAKLPSTSSSTSGDEMGVI